VLDANFDRWFSSRTPPRKATDADCKYSCTHDKHTWCVGYEFIASESGTCRLFDNCKTGASELNGQEKPGLNVNVGFRRREGASAAAEAAASAAAGVAAAERSQARSAAAASERATAAEEAAQVAERRRIIAAEVAAAAAEAVAQRAAATRAFHEDMARHGLNCPDADHCAEADPARVDLGRAVPAHHDARPPHLPDAALPFIALSDGVPDW
jgi:hypothetical protein